MILAEKDGALAGLWFERQRYFPKMLEGKLVNSDDSPTLDAAIKWLDRYFAGEKPAASELHLAPTGTDFQRRVWKELCAIPYGEVVTYGSIAKKLAAERGRVKMSAQAVGGAVGHNPISVIIPCHRVIGSNGNLVGYAGGIERKIALLEHEKVDITNLSAPYSLR